MRPLQASQHRNCILGGARLTHTPAGTLNSGPLFAPYQLHTDDVENLPDVDASQEQESSDSILRSGDESRNAVSLCSSSSSHANNLLLNWSCHTPSFFFALICCNVPSFSVDRLNSLGYSSFRLLPLSQASDQNWILLPFPTDSLKFWGKNTPKDWLFKLSCTISFHTVDAPSVLDKVGAQSPPERPYLEQTTDFHKLLVALVSSYRYEGTRVHQETAKSEAKTLCTAIKNAGKKNPIADGEVVRILSTRSKLHLKAVFNHYKEISGNNIDEDLVAHSSLKDTVQCLSTPYAYFIRVLDSAMSPGVDENTKEGLTRVIVTRADVDMKVIKEEYHKQNKVTLTEKIERVTKGNFKDFLMILLARGG